MHYDGQVYRPPTEGNTALLQVTTGCSYNKCTFCTMYNQTPFRVSPEDEVIADLKESVETGLDRIFLLNGDVFVLSTDRLLRLSELIRLYLEDMKTILCYASMRDIKRKSLEELRTLKEAGYSDLHIGIETGYKPAFEMMNKGVTYEEQLEGLEKLKKSGLDYMALLMFGVAGRGKGLVNAEATAELLNRFPPKSILVTTTGVMPGSRLEKLREEGIFTEATERENIEEEIRLVESLKLEGETFFFGSHMLNFVRVSDRLKNKKRILNRLYRALEDTPPEQLDTVKKRFAL